MHKPTLHDTLHASRLDSLLILGALAVSMALAWPSATAVAQSADKKTDLSTRPEFREPVVLTSKDGVLEVRLTARQGQATLDTVATPVQNFLLFDYEVIRGTASDGQKSGGNLYPAPTLQVFPGERLIVHFENSLTGLTIRDYFIPQYTLKDQPVSPLPGADDLLTNKSSHAWSSHHPEGKCRQCHAAYPSGDVEYLHLRLGTCRKGCIGITVTFMDSPQHKSMRVSWGCLRLGERMATCRSSPRSAFPSGTWRCSTISSLTAPAVWRSSTI